METTKKVYEAPAFESIVVDNEISLVLATNPPVGPGESGGGQFEENWVEEHF
jgi:hypothetical protein